MNVVPSAGTVRTVQAMLLAARKSNGADAAMQHTYDVAPEQFPALVGVLLRAVLAAEGGTPLVLETAPSNKGGMCADCSAPLAIGDTRRGLCGACYYWHRHRGTLGSWPAKRVSA